MQAEFSFAHWPFSLKLLWAPIVDSLYYSRFGRRKSWLIPTQYLIGLFMLILSSQVNRWLGAATDADDSAGGPNVPLLTAIFFCLNFLAATQDIAVDGWALTMLKPRNVGHASTCNSVGQTAGYFFGYVVFMALESRDFCNTYLGLELKEGGLITLSGFLWFWGLVFLSTTTLVAIFKRETRESSHSPAEQGELSIGQTYQLLLDIVKMRPIQLLALILMTVKVAFAACDAVSSLKLIDAGVPKDKLALLVVPLVPLQIVLPLVISKYTTGPKPMAVYLKAIPYRLGLTLVAASLVYLTPFFVNPTTGAFPLHYYLLLIVNYSLYQVTLYSMFVAVMAFFAKISDPAVGGTYMTLLNTVCNLGGNWPTTIMLWLVDVLTWRRCAMPEGMEVPDSNDCSNAKEQEVRCCLRAMNVGGVDDRWIDGHNTIQHYGWEIEPLLQHGSLELLLPSPGGWGPGPTQNMCGCFYPILCRWYLWGVHRYIDVLVP